MRLAGSRVHLSDQPDQQPVPFQPFRSTVKKAFHHGHASYGGNGLDCVIFQSTLGRQDGDLLHSEANRTWSLFHHPSCQANRRIRDTIGNSVITDIACEKDGISISGFNCAATINNNHFYNGGTGNNERVFLEDNAQKSLRDESFQEVKTVTMPYPILINRVQNDLHAGHNWGGASCYVQFNYSDGSNQNSNTNFNGDGSWNTYYYSNPQRGKPVISVKIYLKQFQDAYLAYEKNDKILIVGGAICIPFSKDLSINNNLFRDIHKYGYGVLIGNAPSLSGEIISNIFWHSSGSWHTPAVLAPAGSVCTNNYFQSSDHSVSGDLANYDNFNGQDPGFENAGAGDYSIRSDSILKDKGPVDFRYNDHDGTRNGVGMHGGHNFDPTGKTTSNPVVISSDQSVYQITTGETAPLLIKVRGAVSTP